MSFSTKVRREWLFRMGIAGTVFAVFTLWCLYDGLVTYPGINKELDRIEAETGGADLKPEFTVSGDGHGEGERKTEWDIRVQFIMAGICLFIAAPICRRVVWALPKSMHAEEDAFVTVTGQRIPYDAVTELDMRKWIAKSIVTVHYETDGVEGTTNIDDWIFHGGEEVLAAIEKHTGLGRQPEDAEQDEEPPEATADGNDASADASPPPEKA